MTADLEVVPFAHNMSGDEIERCRKERRFHVVAFSPDYLLMLCRGRYEVVEHDLPEKWHVLHGYWEPTSDCVCVVICSPSYDEVPLGEVVPHVSPAVLREHKCGKEE